MNRPTDLVSLVPSDRLVGKLQTFPLLHRHSSSKNHPHPPPSFMSRYQAFAMTFSKGVGDEQQYKKGYMPEHFFHSQDEGEWGLPPEALLELHFQKRRKTSLCKAGDLL